MPSSKLVVLTLADGRSCVATPLFNKIPSQPAFTAPSISIYGLSPIITYLFILPNNCSQCFSVNL